MVYFLRNQVPTKGESCILPVSAMIGVFMVFTTMPLDSLLASVSSESEADSSLDIPPMACASLSGITAAFQI